MLELNNALNLIVKGLESTTKEFGFKSIVRFMKKGFKEFKNMQV